MLPCCQKGIGQKPRMLVLEVRDKADLEGEPIAWLLVERHEYSTLAGTALELSYLRLTPAGNVSGFHGEFRASYSPHTQTVSLSSSNPYSGRGFITLDLKGLAGQRIGTYLMNEVVQWAKQWPHAKINPLHLMEAHAQDESSRTRRNRFYEQFGLRFDFTDPSEQAGRSRPITPAELVTVDTWQQNIRELPFDGFLADLLRKQRDTEFELREAAAGEKRMTREFRQAWDRPLRWALSIVVQRHGVSLAVASAGAALASIAWLRW